MLLINTCSGAFAFFFSVLVGLGASTIAGVSSSDANKSKSSSLSPGGGVSSF